MVHFPPTDNNKGQATEGSMTVTIQVAIACDGGPCDGGPDSTIFALHLEYLLHLQTGRRFRMLLRMLFCVYTGI